MARDGFDTQSRWAFEAADSTVRPRDEPPPEHSPLRQSVLPVAMVLVGLGLVVAAIVASPGWGTYICGVVIAALGIGLLLWRLLRWHVLVRLMTAVVATAVLIAVAVVAVRGLPSSPPLSARVVGGPTGVRIGSVVYSGAAWGDDTGGAVRAYDLAARRLRWRGPAGSRLLAVTPQMIVVHKGPTVLGLDPKSGKVRWRRRASWSVDAVSYGDGVLVTGQSAHNRPVTVAYRLASGRTAWSERSALPTAEVGAGGSDRPALASPQSVVLMVTPSRPDESLPRAIRLVRCATGRRVVRLPHTFDLEGVRIVDGVLINQDPSSGAFFPKRFAGWSATTGKKLWSIPITKHWLRDPTAHERVRLPEHWDDTAGSGPTVVIPEDLSGDTLDYKHFVLLDVRNGSKRTVTPPAGWRSTGFLGEDQRGPQVWSKVRGPHGSVGLWRVGATKVLRIDATHVGPLYMRGASGWAYVWGTRRDVLGDPHSVVWAVSPRGKLYGPFPMGNSWPTYVADGLLRIGDGVYPLS